MGFKEELERLESSKEFKDWKNESNYIVHGFIMINKGNETPWQIGYYDKVLDKVTSFFMEENIKKSTPADVFKKEGSVKELDLGKVKLDLDEALSKAKQGQKKSLG